MQSGNSVATSSGPRGAASAVAPRKSSMRGCWRKGESLSNNMSIKCGGEKNMDVLIVNKSIYGK